MSRLESVSPQLAAEIRTLRPASRSELARIASEFAVSVAGPPDPKFREVFESFRAGLKLEKQTVDWLASFAEELDEFAWKVEEDVDSGEAVPEDYLRAFSMARAASAVAFAAAEDAAESVYEASATVDDPSSLWELLLRNSGKLDH